jgi:hypothetical protein
MNFLRPPCVNACIFRIETPNGQVKMWFDGREIKDSANSISADSLTADFVYFIVTFIDESMCVPQLVPVKYVKRVDNIHYFAYISDIEGVADDEENEFVLVDEVAGVYTFEVALEVLLATSIRRKRRGF